MLFYPGTNFLAKEHQNVIKLIQNYNLLLFCLFCVMVIPKYNNINIIVWCVDVIVDYMIFYIPQATLISQSSGAVVASPRSIVVSTQGKIIQCFFEYI